jgi:hypothetical protein
MNNSLNKLKSVILISAVLPLVVIAGDGSLGSTSSTTSIITLVVTDAVQITGLDNIDFSNANYSSNNNGYGAGDNSGISANDDFCVFVNGAGTYELTATAAAGSFTLTGAGSDANSGSANDTIAYTVGLTGSTTPSTSAVTYNAATGVFTGSQDRDCSDAGGTNANVNIMLTDAVLRTALSDTYTDTITLLVSPN